MIFIEISTHLNIPKEDIEFVDIHITKDKDVELFIDPTCIEWTSGDPWSARFLVTISSFTNSLFNSIRHSNNKVMRGLLSHSGEANLIKLGYSNQRYGTGNTEDSLYDIFKKIPVKLLNNPTANINDFLITCRGFAEDGMSDLLGNVLLKDLYKYTVSIAKKYDISLGKEKVFIGFYWNTESSSWEELHDYPLIIEDLIIILTPKHITRFENIVTTSRYFSYQLVEYHQSLHFEKKSSLCQIKKDKNDNVYLAPPTKLSVEKYIIDNLAPNDTKNTLLNNFIEAHPESYNEFYKKIYKNRDNFSL